MIRNAIDQGAATGGPCHARKTLRRRWLDGERLLGTFVKTTSHQVVEILAQGGLDFIVLDAEHAPFDAASLDVALLAARALDLPALVRIREISSSSVLAALDMGADGVLVPHVSSGETALRVATAARYRGGARGFSASPRAADYGRADIEQYIHEADERTLVIAQIEDAEALNHLEELVSVPGIDGFFVGRADLALSLGSVGSNSPELIDAVNRIASAARRASRPWGLFLSGPHEVDEAEHVGATLFVIASDQSLLKQGAQAISRAFQSRDLGSHE